MQFIRRGNEDLETCFWYFVNYLICTRCVSVLRGGDVQTMGDHRFAMSAAVLACRAEGPVVVDDATVVAKSYPAFWEDFEQLEREEP